MNVVICTGNVGTGVSAITFGAIPVEDPTRLVVICVVHVNAATWRVNRVGESAMVTGCIELDPV